MATFNGHKNWNHWNVSLWLNNDETLYRKMLEELRTWGSKEMAAKYLIHHFRVSKITHTPDGAPYTFTSIRAAMRGLDA